MPSIPPSSGLLSRKLMLVSFRAVDLDYVLNIIIIHQPDHFCWLPDSPIGLCGDVAPSIAATFSTAFTFALANFVMRFRLACDFALPELVHIPIVLKCLRDTCSLRALVRRSAKLSFAPTFSIFISLSATFSCNHKCCTFICRVRPPIPRQ